MIHSAAEFFAPLSIDEFRSEYWRRRPVQIKGDPKKVEGVFDHTRFFEYCGHPAVDLYAGQTFHEVKFQQVGVNAHQAERLFRHGFTIQCEDLHLAHPVLLEVANHVRDALGIFSAMEAGAFLSSPGVGFGFHIDPNPDIFSLQIAGTKRWTFSKLPAMRYPLTQTVLPPKGPPRGDPWQELERPKVEEFIQIEQQPGDIFYFPGGVWHATATLGESNSCHVVLASTNDTWAELLFSALRPKLDAREAWRNVGDRSSTTGPEMHAQVAARVAELKEVVAGLEVDELMALLVEQRAARAKGGYRQHYVAQAQKGHPKA